MGIRGRGTTAWPLDAEPRQYRIHESDLQCAQAGDPRPRTRLMDLRDLALLHGEPLPQTRQLVFELGDRRFLRQAGRNLPWSAGIGDEIARAITD